MKRLVRLARELNFLIIVLHHIGKARAEDGVVREAAHRGRGASAWADFPAAIFNLEASAKDRSQITVTCAKRKSGENYEIVMNLDRETRWLSSTQAAPSRPVTNDDKVLEVLRAVPNKRRETNDLERALVDTKIMSRRTLMVCLGRLVSRGVITKPRRGLYHLQDSQAYDCGIDVEPDIVIEVEEHSAGPAQAKVQSADAYKDMQNCTLDGQNNGNGPNGLGESAESADSYVNLHNALLPDDLAIPVNVPNDEESIGRCIDAQRIAKVA